MLCIQVNHTNLEVYNSDTQGHDVVGVSGQQNQGKL
jgi:hypothetical protein